MSEFRFNDEIKVTSFKRFDELRKEIQLQNASVFNDKNIKTQECIEILVNLIYLLNQGEKFTDNEKETLFFSVTKLLHSANITLRRLIFLFVKHWDFWQNSFILTGSLISEINKSDENLIKPNCFRWLGQIIDINSVSVVERLLKIAISSQSSEVASSAMVCTLFMVFKGFNVAKSWISEIANKLTSSLGQDNLLTFHTLLLIKQIKESDRLFLIKTYLKIAESSERKSQFAICQLIRYVSDIMKREDLNSATLNSFNTFLERNLYQIEDSIKIEACRAILDSTKTKDALKKNAIGGVCDLLSSSNNIVRFASLKTWDKHISKYSEKIAVDIFIEIEKIIEDTDVNSSIKAIALSIFLRISKGLSDFRLEKMFKTFIEQYPHFKEDFKKEIIIISKAISRENKAKNKLYFSFFCSWFKLDAGAQTKLEILDAISWFIYNDEELKVQSVFFLAEFINDCQHEVVKIRILNWLGKECVLTSSPIKLVRYIYNQIILESPMVRVSSICALGEIASKIKNLRTTILGLIKQSFIDPDNEVRSRAFSYYQALTKLDDEDAKTSNIVKYIITDKENNANHLNIDVIQSILKSEKENWLNSGNISTALNSILMDPDKVSQILLKNKWNEPESKDGKGKGKADGKGNTSSTKKSGEEDYVDEYKKTVFAKVHGTPKITSSYCKLTDQSAEYMTSYRKIIHDKCVIFDFEITNTIELQVISDITIEIEDWTSSGFDFDSAEIIKVDKLSTNQKGHLYFKINKKDDEVYASSSFHIVLKFDLQELDVKGNPHGIAVKEQYKIDKLVEVTYADYFVVNSKVNWINYNEIWKMAEKSNYFKAEEKMGLPYNNIKNAAKKFSEIIGFMPINEINKIEPNAKRFEFIYAYQSYLENLLFIKYQVMFNDANKCLAHVVVLCQDESVPQMIMDKIYA